MCVLGGGHLRLPPDRFLRTRWRKMIRDGVYLMVHGVWIIGCTYNAQAGSIGSRRGMHHNPVHLWKRAICCCRGQSDTLWIIFAFVNHTAPPKTTDRCKTEAGRDVGVHLSSRVTAFPAKLFTYGAWLSHSCHAREVGMIYFCLFK